MRWTWVVAFALTGCGLTPYRTGGLLAAKDVEPRAVRSLGCVEVGTAVLGPAHEGDAGLLLLRMGNRCMEPALFDLRAAHFYGVSPDGLQQPLELVDPRGEIARLHVDGFSQGVEKVRLRGAVPGVARTVCVDFTGASGAGRAAPVCFVDSGLRWEVQP